MFMTSWQFTDGERLLYLSMDLLNKFLKQQSKSMLCILLMFYGGYCALSGAIMLVQVPTFVNAWLRTAHHPVCLK